VALGTIFDDDTAPKLSINNVSITEGNSGITNAVFTVQRSGNLGQPFTLSYSTADGTATAGSDYVATSGSLVFASGETIKKITVPVIGDLNIEGDETFFVNLSTKSSPNLAQIKATIVNDDGVPLISINDASILEGWHTSFFISRCCQASAQPVVGYRRRTERLWGSDYVATNGS
jgi:hypothetical protein